MKGLRKQITRAVNPNPRSCPPPTIKNKPRTVVDPRTPPKIVESNSEEVLPNLDSEKKIEEKKSIKTQTTTKNAKWKNN